MSTSRQAWMSRWCSLTALIVVTVASLASPAEAGPGGKSVTISGRFAPAGIAPGEIVELLIHNDFCGDTAGVEISVVNAVTGLSIGSAAREEIEAAVGLLFSLFEPWGPATRRNIAVRVGLTCDRGSLLLPAIQAIRGVSGFNPSVVLEVVDVDTLETIRTIEVGGWKVEAGNDPK